MLNILPKVSNLTSLLAINLMKIETDFSNKHVISCWSLDQRVMFGCWYIFCRWRCILFVTWPNKTTPLRCHSYLWVIAPCSMSPPWKVWWSYVLSKLRGKTLCGKTRYCVCWVYSFSNKIKLKICNVKKNNSKCTKFTIKK